jgi:hypothetical protein
MLCEVCYGKRFVAVNGRLLPCPECGAAGEVHCCEGMQEQPEPAADRREEPSGPALGAPPCLTPPGRSPTP